MRFHLNTGRTDTLVCDHVRADLILSRWVVAGHQGVFVLNSLSCKAAHLRLPVSAAAEVRTLLRCAARTVQPRRIVSRRMHEDVVNRYAWANRAIVAQVTVGHPDGSTVQGSCRRRGHRFVGPLEGAARNGRVRPR